MKRCIHPKPGSVLPSGVTATRHALGHKTERTGSQQTTVGISALRSQQRRHPPTQLRILSFQLTPSTRSGKTIVRAQCQTTEGIADRWHFQIWKPDLQQGQTGQRP